MFAHSLVKFIQENTKVMRIFLTAFVRFEVRLFNIPYFHMYQGILNA